MKVGIQTRRTRGSRKRNLNETVWEPGGVRDRKTGIKEKTKKFNIDIPGTSGGKDDPVSFVRPENMWMI